LFYLYLDRRKDNNEPIYVGIGTENRVKDFRRNKYHSAIKKKFGINREILLSSEDYSWIQIQEILGIKFYNTYHRANDSGCNFTKGGEGTLGLNPYKHMSEETKIRLNALKRNYAKGQNNPASKTRMSKEQILDKSSKAAATLMSRKIKSWNSGKKCPEIAGENNPFYGKSHSNETIKIMSEKRAAYYETHDHHGLRVVENIDTKEQFPSIREAAKKYGIYPSSISHVCSGKQRLAGGYKWRYIDV
jgi:hypothetical protein